MATARDEADHPGDGRADDARPDPRRARAGRTSACPHLRHLVVRRRPDAGPGDRAGAGAAAARGLRQRLRAHRDQLDDRRARTRRPPRARSQRRPRRARAASARSAGRCRRSRSRSATPTASPSAAGEAGEIWVRGEQVAGEYLGRSDVIEDGWFPTRDGGLARRRRVPLPRGPARRRHRARRREHVAGRDRGRARRRIPPWPTPPSSACPTHEWGEEVVAAVVLDEGAIGDRGRAAGVGARPPALVEGAAAHRVPSTSCPTTRPASCCAACSRPS